MKNLKLIAAAAALAVSSFSVSASPITVGGVTWDPDAFFDFTASFQFVQNFSNANPLTPGTELFGFGNVTSLNGNNQASFCSSCELTFKFGDFLTDGLGGFIQNSGYIRIYSDSAQNYSYSSDPFNEASATDGNLWLELLAKDVIFSTAPGNSANPYVNGTLEVSWLLGDSTALASKNFKVGAINGNDASSTSNARLNIQNTFNGTGTVFADSIPEPASIAILGLGLLGMAGGRRLAKRKN